MHLWAFKKYFHSRWSQSASSLTLWQTSGVQVTQRQNWVFVFPFMTRYLNTTPRDNHLRPPPGWHQTLPRPGDFPRTGGSSGEPPHRARAELYSLNIAYRPAWFYPQHCHRWFNETKVTRLGHTRQSNRVGTTSLWVHHFDHVISFLFELYIFHENCEKRHKWTVRQSKWQNWKYHSSRTAKYYIVLPISRLCACCTESV